MVCVRVIFYDNVRVRFTTHMGFYDKGMTTGGFKLYIIKMKKLIAPSENVTHILRDVRIKCVFL